MILVHSQQGLQSEMRSCLSPVAFEHRVERPLVVALLVNKFQAPASLHPELVSRLGLSATSKKCTGVDRAPT